MLLKLKASWMGIYQRGWELTDASRSGGFVRCVMELSGAPCHGRPENSRWLCPNGVNVKRDDWIIKAVIQSGRREWKSSSVSDCDSTSGRHCFVSLKARNKQPSESLPDTSTIKVEISYRRLLSARRLCDESLLCGRNKVVWLRNFSMIRVYSRKKA